MTRDEMQAKALRWWIGLGDDEDVVPSLLSLLTEVAADARNEALGDAAKVCDIAQGSCGASALMSVHLAARIRALAAKETT